MNALINSDVIKEVHCNNDFMYVLNKGASIQMTEYKVLQNPSNDFFVPCMRITLNGQPTLYYLCESFRPLSGVINEIPFDKILLVVAKIFKHLVSVNRNGFLHITSIESSLDKIFIDLKTMDVRLLYVPLNLSLFETDEIAENNFRTGLLNALIECPESETLAIKTLISNLQSKTKSMLDLSEECAYSGIKASSYGYTANQTSGYFDAKIPQAMLDSCISQESSYMKLTALNVPFKIELNINKDRFVIGKKESVVDGVLLFSRMISRIHCVVTRENGAIYIMDLGSSNGTFVNGKRLGKEEKMQLFNGDIVRLASSDFEVEI